MLELDPCVYALEMLRSVARAEGWTRTARRKAEATLRRQPAHTLRTEVHYWGERRAQSHLRTDWDGYRLAVVAAAEAGAAIRRAQRATAAALRARQGGDSRRTRGAKTSKTAGGI
jgi:hypothetical protein